MGLREGFENRELLASKQPLSDDALESLRLDGHSEDAISFAVRRLSEKSNVSSPLRLARKIIAEDFRPSTLNHQRLGCEDCDAGYRPIVEEYIQGNFVTEFCPRCRPGGRGAA